VLQELQALRSGHVMVNETLLEVNTRFPCPLDNVSGNFIWVDPNSSQQYVQLLSTLFRPQPAPAPTEVALTRATYPMPAAKAEALGKFLKDHVKAPVLETKVEGDSLIVTTTPEVQRSLKGLVDLVLVKEPAPVRPAKPQPK
jgi:hypothetical protein